MSAGQVVRRLAGIQAQFPSAAGLAVKARTVDLVSGDVERALHEERSIVRTWAMRGTLHLITAEDYPWLVPLTTSFTGARRRLTQEGVPADRAAKAVRLIERMLEKEGPLTRAEIVERLTRRGIRTQGQAGAHLVRLAALEGVVCHGPNRDGEPTFVVVRDWLPQERSKGPDVPLGELALRYLAAHAPAGPEDLAAWSGVRLSDARRGWQEIADSLVEVEVQGTALWMLRSQTFDADSPFEGDLRAVREAAACVTMGAPSYRFSARRSRPRSQKPRLASHSGSQDGQAWVPVDDGRHPPGETTSDGGDPSP